MSKEANNYTTKSNSTPLPTGKGVRPIISGGGTGCGSYCTDLITNYNNNHTKWSKEVQEIALDMMQAHC